MAELSNLGRLRSLRSKRGAIALFSAGLVMSITPVAPLHSPLLTVNSQIAYFPITESDPDPGSTLDSSASERSWFSKIINAAFLSMLSVMLYAHLKKSNWWQDAIGYWGDRVLCIPDRYHWAMRSRGISSFKPHSPQGDGNLKRNFAQGKHQPVSNPIPRKGTKTCEKIYRFIGQGFHWFKLFSPQGDETSKPGDINLVEPK